MTADPALGVVPFALTDAARPLLVLGPSLGTSVTALWQDVVPLLPDVDVVGWDLPGHGSAPAPDPGGLAGLTVPDLARAVLDVVARAQAERGDVGAPFWYAGVSVGGAVGLHLLLDAPGRLHGAALICTAASFGEPGPWLDRARLVESAGTPTQVEGSARRWFGPGFVEREPRVVLRLLGSLQTADRFGYGAVCRALAAWDVRPGLAGAGGHVSSVPVSSVPVVTIAGEHDLPAPPAALAEIARGVGAVRSEVLDGVAHLAPAEAPARVAELVRDLVTAGVAR
ncbi:alpha/beta fold hydrolase [Promicromonospora sp. NPDC050880]|uniref:alpha/beta fold hydrolase n=1 Tax=unclassified Promicromonospora TaxID=2647929 RepID=UPI00379A4436